MGGRAHLGTLVGAMKTLRGTAVVEHRGVRRFATGWAELAGMAERFAAELARRGIGQSAWIGVGGDQVKGTRFAELVPVFAARRDTEALLVVGEIGGTEEEELARALAEFGRARPVFALIAGAAAREGVTMGHAGALVHGASGTIASKRAALEAAGAQVFDSIAAIVEAVSRAVPSRP